MAFVVMAVLALAAGLWMTRPLWRNQVDGGQRRRAANVAAYRQRLREMEADQAAGLLDAETAAGLRTELDARLVLDADTDDSGFRARDRRPVFAVAVAALIVGLAVAGYAVDGSWKVQQRIAAAPAAGTPAAVDVAAAPGSVEDMVAKLSERLEQDPADVDGWAMLGRSYFVLERYQDAAKAYAKANELSARQEPDLLVNEGEALALARDRDLLGAPQTLFDAALVLAPQHSKALWYAGLAAEQAGQFTKAQTHWVALSQQDLPEALQPVLKERLELVAARTGQAIPPALVAAAAAPAPAPPPPAAAAPIDADAPVLRVAVTVGPELIAQMSPDATLFVFAKAASGPPMPLAVYRGQASELPRTVTLDDSMAMMPALKLSGFEEWIVTARVTRAGGVQASSGDLQGSLTVARKDLGKAALALIIDQVVP